MNGPVKLVLQEHAYRRRLSYLIGLSTRNITVKSTQSLWNHVLNLPLLLSRKVSTVNG